MLNRRCCRLLVRTHPSRWTHNSLSALEAGALGVRDMIAGRPRCSSQRDSRPNKAAGVTGIENLRAGRVAMLGQGELLTH